LARLVVFEGFDGAGKSTLVRRVNAELLRLGYDTIAVKSFAGNWVPKETMGEVVMSNLPYSAAAQLRLHRYLMQYSTVVQPSLKAGLHVMSDRGPISAIWRLERKGRQDLVCQAEPILSDVALYILVETSAEICLQRITRTRRLTRVETGLRFCEGERAKDEFVSSHESYYRRAHGLLEPLPHIVVRGDASTEELMQSCLASLVPLLAPSESQAEKGPETVQCKWLENVGRGETDGISAPVAELLNSPHGTVRREAITTLRRIGKPMDLAHVDRLIHDADKGVRRAAAAAAAELPAHEHNILLNSLTARPGLPLAEFAEALQASGLERNRDLALLLLKSYPYVTPSVAVGTRKQREIGRELLALILTHDDARPVFIPQLGADCLTLPFFEELERDCQKVCGDNTIGSIAALHAKAASQQPGGLLNRGSLLYSDNSRLALAAVEGWLGCGLGSWIPQRFDQHADFDIRRRLAIANFPNRIFVHPKVSPVDNVFISPRPAKGEEYPFVALNAARSYAQTLLELGFARVLILTSESEDLSHYGIPLDQLYEAETCGRIEALRFPIPRFGIPISSSGSPDHEGIREVVKWLLESPLGFSLVHCSGGNGRTGLVIGCALVQTGSSPDAAIHSVLKGGYIRDDGQREFVTEHYFGRQTSQLRDL